MIYKLQIVLGRRISRQSVLPFLGELYKLTGRQRMDGKGKDADHFLEWIKFTPYIFTLLYREMGLDAAEAHSMVSSNVPLKPEMIELFSLTHDQDPDEAFVVGVTILTCKEGTRSWHTSETNGGLNESHGFYPQIDHFFLDHMTRTHDFLSIVAPYVCHIKGLLGILKMYVDIPLLTQIGKLFSDTRNGATRLWNIQDDCICCS
jgi:hypothetical protein